MKKKKWKFNTTEEDIDKIADFHCFSKNECGKIALTPLMGTALLADVTSSLTEYDAEY
jgi:hypothetical protein